MSISSRAGWKDITKRMQSHKVKQQGFEQQTPPHALERAGQQRSPGAWAQGREAPAAHHAGREGGDEASLLPVPFALSSSSDVPVTPCAAKPSAALSEGCVLTGMC